MKATDRIGSDGLRAWFISFFEASEFPSRKNRQNTPSDVRTQHPDALREALAQLNKLT